MKQNDTGDFSVLYVEVQDDKAQLFQLVASQKKPVVIMLADQVHALQRPDDFTQLKHIKRQLDLPIVFVLPNGGNVTQMAARNGFPVYPSIDALAHALSAGQMGRARSLNRITAPLASGGQSAARVASPPAATPKKTEPLHYDASYLAGAPPDPVYQSGQVEKPAIPSHASPVSQSAFRYEEQVPLEKVAGSYAAPQTAARPVPPLEPSLVPRPHPVTEQRRSRGLPLLLVVMTLVVVIGALGSFLILPRVFTGNAPAPAPEIVGQLTFTSSGQLNDTSSQGIEDQVVVDLNHLTPPAANMQYYAWLLGDKALSDPSSLLLGSLQVAHGNAHLYYGGDAQHDNLLLTNSRFLVTEESAAVTPIAPSPDQSNWRYYGEFSTTPVNSPDNPKHYSYLDHLRHLLAADPTLDELELPGGLNNWFYQNVGKVLEWVSSTRDQWEQTKDVGFVQRQTARTLQYLDGNTFVGRDLPPNAPLLADERLASIGLLSVDGPAQEPPSYMQHMIQHLNGLLQAGGSTPTLRKKLATLITAMNNVQGWLQKVRSDAQQLMKMSDDQLQQPGTLTLLNDMIENASSAYTGQLDPNTNTTREGVSWIHDHMQELATLNISVFTTSMRGPVPEVMPTRQPAQALVPDGAKR